MDILKRFTEENGIELNELQVRQIAQFAAMLVETNKTLNLTAITEEKEIEIKHMVDSLEGAIPILKNVGCKKEFSLVDVGTGAGFPGLPLKIVFPEADVTLLDSLNKRVNFINGVIDALGLSNVRGVAARAEDFAQTEKRESFDVCTSRAVARMNVLLEYCLPLVKVGGFCILYKSIDCDEEIKEAETAIRVLGGRIQEIIHISLPKNAGDRSLIIIKKEKKTPGKYPRKAGKPSRNPIV